MCYTCYDQTHVYFYAGVGDVVEKRKPYLGFYQFLALPPKDFQVSERKQDQTPTGTNQRKATHNKIPRQATNYKKLRKTKVKLRDVPLSLDVLVHFLPSLSNSFG